MWRSCFQRIVFSCNHANNYSQVTACGTSVGDPEQFLNDPDTFGTLSEDISNFKDAPEKDSGYASSSSSPSVANDFSSQKFETTITTSALKSLQTLQTKAELRNKNVKTGEQLRAASLQLEFEEGEEESATEITLPRLTSHGYARKMLALCKEKRLLDAIEVLEVEMKELDAVPDNYCYNVLINACGKAGYTQKAFQLYYQMKARGLTPQKFAYTGLFNACANSPWPTTDGLERCKKLRKQLDAKEYLLNQINYHAMIKAFGRCGDIQSAFEIPDEMLAKNCLITAETFNFLLQACITDKEAGFRHSLLAWKKMRNLRIRPNIYSYNLLLRCIKECNIGDTALSYEILGINSHSKDTKSIPSFQSNPNKKSDLITTADILKVEGRTMDAVNAEQQHESKQNKELILSDVEIVSNEVLNPMKETPSLPDLLGKKSHSGEAIGLTSLEKPQERLMVVGGVTGVLHNMKRDRVTPGIATFTLFLESLPPSIEMENELLSKMKDHDIKPDIIFCNMLIRRRSMRAQVDEAKEVLQIMQEYLLPPDLITFGCLAIGCKKPVDIERFLRDIDGAGARPNEEIMEILLKNTMAVGFYKYGFGLLNRLRDFGIKPTENMLLDFENRRKKIRKKLIMAEKGERPMTELIVKNNVYFLKTYSFWLKRQQKMSLTPHPWTQYGYEEYKDNIEKST